LLPRRDVLAGVQDGGLVVGVAEDELAAGGVVEDRGTRASIARPAAQYGQKAAPQFGAPKRS
jgi:hypothetical protein